MKDKPTVSGRVGDITIRDGCTPRAALESIELHVKEAVTEIRSRELSQPETRWQMRAEADFQGSGKANLAMLEIKGSGPCPFSAGDRLVFDRRPVVFMRRIWPHTNYVLWRRQNCVTCLRSRGDGKTWNMHCPIEEAFERSQAPPHLVPVEMLLRSGRPDDDAKGLWICAELKPRQRKRRQKKAAAEAS